MKILVDGIELLDINETQKKIIADDVNIDIIEDDIKRRLKWVIQHKCDFNMERLKKYWIPKLEKEGIKSIPTNNEELAEIIFAHKDYKGAKSKILESGII